MPAKHTPGPWTLNTAINEDETLDCIEDSRYIIGADATLVADLYADTHLDLGLPSTDAEIKANANLIMAAPDLLEALKAILGGQLTGKVDTDAQRFQNARAAIRKAEGKE